MKLYASLTSPYARKVRISLHEKRLSCELVQTEPASPDGPLSRINPLGKVPALERDDGSVLFDSPVIVEWLDSVSEPCLLPTSGEDRWQTLLWQALADGMMDATVTRMLELRRAEDRRSDVALARQEEKIERALDWAEQRMRDRHLVAGRFTLADVALASALDYLDLRHPHGWRDSRARLTGWHAQMIERRSFVETEPPGLVRPGSAS